MLKLTGGSAGGRTLKTPEGLDTRPALARVRESLFNILMRDVPGSVVLDTFAGSGALAFEALSRDAEHAVAIELSQNCVEIIRANAELLDWTDRCTVVHTSAFDAPIHPEVKSRVFDVVFIDPPYPLYNDPASRQAISDMMNALVENGNIADDAVFVVEHRTKDPFVPDGDRWQVDRTKKYGQTTLSFLSIS
jgi:16S rRNA (guanine(966)-N(2))-methyltransferase RsmD